jgi:hypothetical protein
VACRGSKLQSYSEPLEQPLDPLVGLQYLACILHSLGKPFSGVSLGLLLDSIDFLLDSPWRGLVEGSSRSIASLTWPDSRYWKSSSAAQIHSNIRQAL